MKKHGALIHLLFVPLVMVLVTGAVSWLNWGYFLFPPSHEAVTNLLGSVETFTVYRNEGPLSGTEVMREKANLAEDAWLLVEPHPPGGFANTLATHHLGPTRQDAVDPGAAMEINSALAKHNSPCKGAGIIVTGTDKSGKPLVVTAANVRTEVDDLFMYCEAALRPDASGKFEVIRHQSYGYDFAGREGIDRVLGILAGILFFVFGGPRLRIDPEGT